MHTTFLAKCTIRLVVVELYEELSYGVDGRLPNVDCILINEFHALTGSSVNSSIRAGLLA